MSLFTELKTLIENDSERSVCGTTQASNMETDTSMDDSGSQSRGAASSDAPRKHQRAGDEKAAYADVPALMA